jgi:membrane-bound acyltransferase YfiQ involved in biofilm formation
MLGFTFPTWFSVLAPPVLSGPLAEWAIFFPLGLVYVINAKSMNPYIQRWRWVLVGLTLGLYALAWLDALSIIDVPLPRYINPVFFMLVITTIKRDSIPKVRQFEIIGKKAYGLYLLNLIVLDLVLLLVQVAAPGLFAFQIVLLPVYYILALFIPLFIMQAAERSPVPRVYRYVFG